MSGRSVARSLAAEAVARGRPLAWFETLYARAEGKTENIPWADLCANPNLRSWAEQHGVEGQGQDALVIGCGLGDDAEYLRELGFQTFAFDISETAIAWCRTRFVGSSTDFRAADLFALPESWRKRFAFVLESYTLQVLPEELRQSAMDRIAACVSQQGTLLVLTRGREATERPGHLPWPLARHELGRFIDGGLTEVAFEDYMDEEDPPVRRFRVEYLRPGTGGATELRP